MKKQDEKWGLFWCKLLDPIIFAEIAKADINQYLKKLSQEEVVYPDGKRKRPSLSTLRRKYNKYTQGGFKNLARKTRSDRGSIRVVPDEVLATAIELKKEQPFRSDYLINQLIEARYGKTIPKSTLYRHLKQAGATRLKLGITKKKVRKRWTREHTHDLWVGDFQDGPYVIDDNGVVRKSHLSLFIDAHSRFVVEGRYYLRETLDILIDSLLRAWVIHGSSKELYLDNAKIYHANALKAACYSLGIKLLHRPAGDPPPGGVVERFFGTNQGQFEAEVRAGDILTLDKLNRAFSAYLRVSYHTAIHSETKQAPQQRYESGMTILRRVDMNAAIEFFMRQETRTVNKDFSDVRLENNYYKVSPKLRGDKVKVRYDPFSDNKKVWIYSLREKYLGQGLLHHRQHGDDGSKENPLPKPKSSLIDHWLKEDDRRLEAQSKGVDFVKLVSKSKWPFASFIHKLSELMGRKGRLATFEADEYKILRKAYNQIPSISEQTLMKAFEHAEGDTVQEILLKLQNVKNYGERK